jgi:hypothetical protein
MESNEHSSDTCNAEVSAKKPYEKPNFRCEKVFVTTALSCGKTSPVTPSCRGANSSS